MRRVITIILSTLLINIALLFPAVTLATTVNDSVDCSQAPSSSFCVETAKQAGNPIFGPKGVLTRGGLILSFLTGAISVFMMVWGGLKFTMSSGDPQKITTAKNTILYASIALAISVSAAAIVQFILKRL